MPETSKQPGTMPVKADRRAHPRQKIQSLTYVELGGGNGGIALNVSEGGMTVVAAQPLDAEGAIEIALQLPQTRKRVTLKGEIRWMSESHKEAGIQFVELSAEQLEDVREWISREASPVAVEENSPLPSMRDAARRIDPAGAFDDDEDEEAAPVVLDAPQAPLETAAARESMKPSSSPSPVSATNGKHSGPRKFERVFEAEHREAEVKRAEASAAREVEPETDDANEESAAELTRPDVQAVVDAATRLSQQMKPAAPTNGRSVRTPFTALASDPPFAPAADPELVERVLETTAALSSATSSSPRLMGQPLGPGLGPAPSLELQRPIFGSAVQSAEPAPEDGSADFRVHLQSPWVLALLVLLLALISFVSGMAVRRGALNRVLGDGESYGAKSGATTIPATVGQSASVSAPSAGAATGPVDIEIIDANNRHWTIPMGAGGAVAQSATPAPTNAGNATAGADGTTSTPTATTTPAAAAADTTAVSPGAAPNQTQTFSNTDLSDATTTDNGNGGLMISLPETPVAATSLVAINARRFIPIPAEAAAKNRNLQVGTLANLVAPIYPADAMAQNVEGIVKMRAAVSADGSIQSLDFVSGPKALMTASLTAVRLWRYNPTLLNGKPIDTQEEITVVYRLPR